MKVPNEGSRPGFAKKPQQPIPGLAKASPKFEPIEDPFENLNIEEQKKAIANNELLAKNEPPQEKEILEENDDSDNLWNTF